MSFEIPKLRVHHPDSVAALSRARDLLVARFDPVSGSDIRDHHSNPKATCIRVRASNPAGVSKYDPYKDVDVVTAELWVPTGIDIPGQGANYTIIRKKITEEGGKLTQLVAEQSHRLLVHLGSGTDINGAMEVEIVNKKTEETNDHDTGESSKKTTEASKARFIQNAEEIDIFLDNALEGITLK